MKGYHLVRNKNLKKIADTSFKLRTVYLYGLNEKADICEDDKNMKSFQSDESIVGSYFLACLEYFKGTKHVNMTTGKEYLY